MYPTKGIRTSFKKPSTTLQTQSQQSSPNQSTQTKQQTQQQHQQQQYQHQKQQHNPTILANRLQNKMGKRDIKRGTVQRSSDAGGKYKCKHISLIFFFIFN